MKIASIVLALVSAALGFWTERATPRADDLAFPHARHATLFPTCAGCHAGIPTGDSAAMFPPTTSCATCHNGQDVKTVVWRGATRHALNLRFDHGRHARLADSARTSIDCQTCHGTGAADQRMNVSRAKPATCIACHGHPAASHYAVDSPCATCHVPLARAVALRDSDVVRLPRPDWHDQSNFVSTHGALAARSTTTCAVCHARESCARCHANAESLGAIRALESDERVAKLVAGAVATYPVPPSHTREDFKNTHGRQARAALQSCATCHTQPGCRTCHTGTLGAREINALPTPGPGRAPGVQLRLPRPTTPPAWPATTSLVHRVTLRQAAAPAVDTPPVARVHSPDIVKTHGPVAASGRLDCAGCHQQRFCTSCHQGNGQRRYHVFNFVARHASEAYARDSKCTSCHNTEVFCRSCHRDVAGIAADSRRRSGTAHSGQPLWLLQHGEAARRGMPGCAGCHQQTDCMQCHSSLGGRVNPHGRNFNAAQMRKQNPSLCAYCHLRVPD